MNIKYILTLAVVLSPSLLNASTFRVLNLSTNNDFEVIATFTTRNPLCKKEKEIIYVSKMDANKKTAAIKNGVLDIDKLLKTPTSSDKPIANRYMEQRYNKKCCIKEISVKAISGLAKGKEHSHTPKKGCGFITLIIENEANTNGTNFTIREHSPK